MSDPSLQDIAALLTELRSAMDEVAQLDDQANSSPIADSEALQNLALCRDRLFMAVYDELRQVAARVRKAPGPLGATSLVHQAYTRLIRNDWALEAVDEQEFFQRAGRVLQQTLIDHARRARSMKAGGDRQRLSLDERMQHLESALNGASLLDLESALDRLEMDDAVAASIVRLHFFGNLQFSDIAVALDKSERSIYRKWQETRARLYSMLTAD